MQRRRFKQTGQCQRRADGRPADRSRDAAVLWLSGGTLKPTRDDFGMLRLILLGLLRQIGGVLLMLSSPRRAFT